MTDYTRHPVDILKDFWSDMSQEVEARLREVCDEPVSYDHVDFNEDHQPEGGNTP